MSQRAPWARSTRALLLAVSVAVFVAACGGSGGGVSDAAAGPLAERVAAVRATAADEPDQARRHLSALRDDVARLRGEGALSEEAAARILNAAEDLEAAIDAATPPTTQAPATTTTAAPPPQVDDDDKDDEGEDDEKGRGKGKEGEKEDD